VSGAVDQIALVQADHSRKCKEEEKLFGLDLQNLIVLPGDDVDVIAA
jgi:hypothetical protein